MTTQLSADPDAWSGDQDSRTVTVTRPRSEPALDERSPSKRITQRADLITYFLYLLGGWWVVSQLWLQVGWRTPWINTGDHQFALWSLSHAADSVVGWHNPLFSNQLNVPDGVNMMANTSMLGLGIPVTPVTLLFGPRVSFALLLTLSLAGTAAAWYIVFRRSVVDSRVAAAVGGAFCGFAPGLIAHGAGQLNFAAQFVLPFIVLGVMRLGEPDHGRRRTITLALLIVYQVFVNEELLLVTAGACAVFVAVYAALNWSKTRLVAATFVRRMAGVALIASIVLAYPLWFQFRGPRHYRGLSYNPDNHPADLGGYVAFADRSLGGSSDGAALYALEANEHNSFFGWPAIILCVLLGWWLRERVLVKAALITGAVVALLSLGSTITIGGWDTGIPGPFRLLTLLPLGNLVIPTRLALLVVPVLGLLLALGADRAARLPWRDASGIPLRGLWVAAYAAALVPLVPTPIVATRLAPAPAFVADGVWREYVPAGRSAVVVPMAFPFTIGQHWSAETRTQMPVPAGYFLGPTSAVDPRAYWGPPPRPTAALLNNVALSGRVPAVTGLDRERLVEDLRYWRAAVVVLGEQANAAQLRAALELLLGPGTQVAGVWLWDVRDMV